MNLEQFLCNADEKPLDRIPANGGFCSIFRTIGCIGDSLSSGEFESEDESGQKGYHDYYEYSWGQYIARMCGSTVYNFSRGGMTAKEYWETFAQANDFWSPDKLCQAYIIALGVNDFNHKELAVGSVQDIDLQDYSRNANTFVGYYGRIIQRLKQMQPRARFFLVTMPQSGEPARDEIALRHGALMHQLAEIFDHTYVIDLREYGPVYDAEFQRAFYLGGHLNPAGYALTGQMIAAYIDYLNQLRVSTLMDTLRQILNNETGQLKDLAERQANALRNLDLANQNVMNIVNSGRGGENGMHGFIAEFAQTGIANARRAFEGLEKSTITLNNNGPADLLINGKPVQVKFYANLMNELKTSAEYRSMDMMFSKDHMDVFRAVMHGDKEVFLNGQPLTSNQVQKIKQIIEEESNIRGLSWDKWMQSSVLKYDQVQREAIDRTFTEETDNIKRQTSEQKSEISNKANTDKAAAYHKAQPNLGEANKAAGVGAAIQGGLNFGIFVYQKHEEGKEIWQFTAEDWKEGGVKTAEGAFKGGFSGYAIYGLTNVCHLSAPSAGAIASGTFGLIDAVMKFRSGEIDDDGFLSLVTINALDATGAAVGAAIGQTLIPVPVVGALIGSIVASNVLGLGKNILSARERAIIAEYQRKADLFVANLDVQYAQILETLLDKYRKLGELQTYAFNLDLNIQLRFAASVDLARFIGVSETEILHNEAEIDDFFL